MRCYFVECKGLGFRYAGTSALARETREELMALFNVRKKDVTIEDAEIPVGKAELLAFVNKLAAQSDDAPVKP